MQWERRTEVMASSKELWKGFQLTALLGELNFLKEMKPIQVILFPDVNLTNIILHLVFGLLQNVSGTSVQSYLVLF